MSTSSLTDRRPLAGSRSGPHTLITGGAGFVGANLAHRLLSEGRKVLILDNLSRPGVERNLAWLRDVHGDAVEIHTEDIRDRKAVMRAVAGAKQVFHFAAQVAVTTSLLDPLEDFAINAQGTLNILEAIRAQATPPAIVMTSTNKVYGGLEDIPLTCEGQRYRPVAPDIRMHGIAESRSLDFHSPYGCSKGTADQYVCDYARSYGLKTVVFRMSCIYGPHQFGTEDQGWVAHFVVRALDGESITLFGDGMQVRDILFVEDLLEAFKLAETHIDRFSGQAFNIGGGPGNVISLLDLLDQLELLHGERPATSFEEWRTGDQRYYVSDTRRFQAATGWTPQINVEQGIRRLYQWLAAERHAKGASTRSPVAASQPAAAMLGALQSVR